MKEQIGFLNCRRFQLLPLGTEIICNFKKHYWIMNLKEVLDITEFPGFGILMKWVHVSDTPLICSALKVFFIPFLCF